MNTQDDPTKTTPTTGSHTEKHTPKKRYPKWVLPVIGIVGLLIVLCVGTVLLVYVYPGDNSVKTAVKNVVPFPVARVEGNMLYLSDLDARVSAAEHFYSQENAAQLGIVQGEPPTIDELRVQEFDRMVQLAVVESIATEYGVAVTDADVEEYFQTVILPQSQGGEPEVDALLEDIYGWTRADFQKYVLYEAVLTQKVQEAMTNDTEREAAVVDRINALHDEILQSSDKKFSEFAEEYSEDPGSASQGGMLGFFGKGVMVPEFEEAAFALEIGEVSEPVRTDFGYHIIKVTDKDEEAETVEARHILLSFQGLDELVQERVDAATVSEYLPRYY